MKPMNKPSIFCIAMLLGLTGLAQVGINEPNPDESSVLELKSIQRGFLMPRMTTLQAGSITAPAMGLMLYNTDYDMPMVLDMSQATAKWAGLQPFLMHINNNQTSTINTNISTHTRVLNVGIGTANPDAKLHVNGTIIAASGAVSSLKIPPAGGVYVQGQAVIDGGLDIAGNVGRRNTSLNQYDNNYYQTTFYGYGAVPIGGIIMWSGPASQVPDGWELCDGVGGRPNLKGRFVVGYDPAGSTDEYDEDQVPFNYGLVGNTGGDDEVVLNVNELPSHTHAKGTLSGVTSENGNHRHGMNADGGSTHSSGSRIRREDDDSGTLYTQFEGDHTHTVTISGSTASAGSGWDHENRPSYYVIAFIIRVK